MHSPHITSVKLPLPRPFQVCQQIRRDVPDLCSFHATSQIVQHPQPQFAKQCVKLVPVWRVKMDAYLTELQDKFRTIVSSIRAREVELTAAIAAIAANEVIEQLGTRNNAA